MFNYKNLFLKKILGMKQSPTAQLLLHVKLALLELVQ